MKSRNSLLKFGLLIGTLVAVALGVLLQPQLTDSSNTDLTNTSAAHTKLNQQSSLQSQASVSNNQKILKTQDTSTVTLNSNSVSSQNTPANTSNNHTDTHDHGADSAVTLPRELEEYIESKRLPGDAIPVQYQGNGRALINTNEQWSTVSMAVIEDGQIKMVERQIQPTSATVLMQ